MSRVLVVDDDGASQRLVRDVLTQAGHEVALAATGEEALSQAAAARPDLVILDIRLPSSIDGLEVARRLRADPARAGIKILAVTAQAIVGDELRILEAGCDRYLSKPIRYRQLLAQVEALLSGR